MPVNLTAELAILVRKFSVGDVLESLVDICRSKALDYDNPEYEEVADDLEIIASEIDI